MEQADAWHLTDRLGNEHGKGDPFAAAVRATRMAMIVTNPRLDDNPIVFVNDAFLRLTGYGRDEIMGHNCRFLQGVQTDSTSSRHSSTCRTASTPSSARWTRRCTSNARWPGVPAS